MESDETEADTQDRPTLHRPINAFLLFCKQHRQIVREKYPTIENRSVTKILGEWWSNLDEEEKSPYTSLAHQYKEAFMKANPEFRWHKMPPGTADSLPPQNAKPSTPSPSNGMVCFTPGLLPPLPSESPLQHIPPSPPSVCAPKPFKKRYLETQQSSTAPPSPSSLSSAGVSPEAARACEALMELARNESVSSRSSEGSERRVSPSDTPPLQTLREAVWSKVAGTLLKQEEDKLVAPPKDCPMNLTNQCTIRGQQIIEHIIENILSIPMTGPLDPSSEPITFSVNNNQERDCHPSPRPQCNQVNLQNGDVGDSIKASIYESLKNDLLKGKVTPSLPATSSRPHNPKSSQSSPTVSPTSARQRGHHKKQEQMTAANSSSPPSGQDMLRLLGNTQLPISVGNSAITITKTPKVSQAPSSPAVVTSCLPSSPVSLSLTRTGPSRGFPASFSLNGGVPVLLSPQGGLVLSSPGQLVLSGRQVQGGECVLLSPMAATGQQVQLGSQHLLLAGTKLVLAPTPAPATAPSSSSPAPAPSNSPQLTHASSPPNCRPPTSDPVNLSQNSGHRSEVSGVATKRPPPADPIGEERRSSRTGRGRRYQEFIEDISSSKKKRRSHRSGEELSESEEQMEVLPGAEQDLAPAALSSPHQPPPSPQHIHWKKMRTAGLGSGESNTQAVTTKLLANQETPTANPTQFDLDAKMEKMEPLKFPENFAKGKAMVSSSKATSSSGRCSLRQAQHERQAHPSKAYDSRLNKKTR